MLARRGMQAAFGPLRAHPDPTRREPDRSGHLHADLPGPRGVIEVFLYAEEAAFKSGGAWYVFETHRYSGPEALAEAFVAALERSCAGS